MYVLWLVCGPVGALASHTAVSHSLAPVACLEPPSRAVLVGTVRALQVLNLIRRCSLLYIWQMEVRCKMDTLRMLRPCEVEGPLSSPIGHVTPLMKFCYIDMTVLSCHKQGRGTILTYIVDIFPEVLAQAPHHAVRSRGAGAAVGEQQPSDERVLRAYKEGGMAFLGRMVHFWLAVSIPRRLTSAACHCHVDLAHMHPERKSSSNRWDEGLPTLCSVLQPLRRGRDI